jgi:predicted Zn-dependent protease
MWKSGIPKWLLAAAVGLTIIAFTPQATFAVGDTPSEPKPKPKPKSKPKPKPKPKDSSLTDDQIYSVGYWQAKDGEYAAALATLHSAANQADPRIQTMIGFSLRKLGRVDEAMEYYFKVLAAYPERTTTRQYLGEAFLQIGEPGKAKDQLAEIGKRCGTACEDYQLLADEIAKFEKQAG